MSNKTKKKQKEMINLKELLKDLQTQLKQLFKFDTNFFEKLEDENKE